MRLIDADALSYEARHYGAYGYINVMKIEDAPTIDAVPVVRCKDCKHRGKEICLMYYVDEGGFGYDLTRDSDYCVFGERKDDDL